MSHVVSFVNKEYELWVLKFLEVSKEALYVDNLKCHVLDASSEDFASWGTEQVSLPKNTTAVLQPLDVHIMGPCKKRLRALALSYELSSIQLNQHLPLEIVPAAEKRKIIATRVLKAWESISEQCIRRAWEKAGLESLY
ncbi:DDE superfamily endonuclease domain [Phytophthora cactorum]|nr:DDE superfamily endonuclease domain [Phytophthora cactorum]